MAFVSESVGSRGLWRGQGQGSAGRSEQRGGEGSDEIRKVGCGGARRKMSVYAVRDAWQGCFLRYRVRPLRITRAYYGLLHRAMAQCAIGMHNVNMAPTPFAHTHGARGGRGRRDGARQPGRTRGRTSKGPPPMCPAGHADGAQLQASGHAGGKYVYCCGSISTLHNLWRLATEAGWLTPI